MDADGIGAGDDGFFVRAIAPKIDLFGVPCVGRLLGTRFRQDDADELFCGRIYEIDLAGDAGGVIPRNGICLTLRPYIISDRSDEMNGDCGTR